MLTSSSLLKPGFDKSEETHTDNELINAGGKSEGAAEPLSPIL
jgi:hypothetical protein